MDQTSPKNGKVLTLDGELQRRIEEFALANGKTTADIVREAFELYSNSRRAENAPTAQHPTEEEETLFDRARRAGLIGCLNGLPPDLSTNKAYLEGFGRE